MFKMAASAFMPGQSKGGDPAAAANDGTRDELAVLRAQMAEMQKKLEALGK